MGKLAYSDSDIVMFYKQAKNKGNEIKILAQLCNTTRHRIIHVLKTNGVTDIPLSFGVRNHIRWSAEEENQLIELKKQGKTAPQIEAILGRSVMAIDNRCTFLREQGKM